MSLPPTDGVELRCPRPGACCRGRGFEADAGAATVIDDLAQLFDATIDAERRAEEAYRALSAAFSYLPEVTDFWSRMADEEARLARGVGVLRAELEPERLRRRLALAERDDAQAIVGPHAARVLGRVRTLSDAYLFACRLENADAHRLFALLQRELMNFDPARARKLTDLLESQIELADFGLLLRDRPGLQRAPARGL